MTLENTTLSLLNRLEEPFRTMVLLAMLFSLRRREIFGLPWKYIDLAESSMRIAESDYEDGLQHHKRRLPDASLPSACPTHTLPPSGVDPCPSVSTAGPNASAASKFASRGSPVPSAYITKV